MLDSSVPSVLQECFGEFRFLCFWLLSGDLTQALHRATAEKRTSSFSLSTNWRHTFAASCWKERRQKDGREDSEFFFFQMYCVHTFSLPWVYTGYA